MLLCFKQYSRAVALSGSAGTRHRSGGVRGAGCEAVGVAGGRCAWGASGRAHCACVQGWWLARVGVATDWWQALFSMLLAVRTHQASSISDSLTCPSLAPHHCSKIPPTKVPAAQASPAQSAKHVCARPSALHAPPSSPGTDLSSTIAFDQSTAGHSTDIA